MMPLEPTISRATAKTGLPPFCSNLSKPARPRSVATIIVTSDHLVLQRLYKSAARNTVGNEINADSASNLLDTPTEYPLATKSAGSHNSRPKLTKPQERAAVL